MVGTFSVLEMLQEAALWFLRLSYLQIFDASLSPTSDLSKSQCQVCQYTNIKLRFSVFLTWYILFVYLLVVQSRNTNRSLYVYRNSLCVYPSSHYYFSVWRMMMFTDVSHDLCCSSFFDGFYSAYESQRQSLIDIHSDLIFFYLYAGTFHLFLFYLISISIVDSLLLVYVCLNSSQYIRGVQ